MRDFFKNKLTNLYFYCGNRQIDKMADDEITMLLDALCNVSKLYNYIPEPEQKRIIEKCLLEDKEYQNLNARLISKWLELNGKKFFTEEAHKETKEYQPATQEQKDFWLQEWRKELDKVTSNFEVRPVSKGEMMRERLYGNTEPSNYKPDSDMANKKLLHQEYIKANYDPLTGNALETWLPEDEWIKKQK